VKVAHEQESIGRPRFGAPYGQAWVALGCLGAALMGLPNIAGAQLTSVTYPTASPPSAPTTSPVLSLVPRPKDPPLSFDITQANLGVMQGNLADNAPAFSTTEVSNITDDGADEEVLGPTDTGGPPVSGAGPGFSYFGVLFNNKLPAGGRITSLTLDFTAPTDITTVVANSFQRNDDLSFPSAAPPQTWNISGPQVIGTIGSDNLWEVVFTANPLFPWDSANDPAPLHPAFTLLASQFPGGDTISFSYLAQGNTPEPGSLAFAASLLAAGIGLRLRRRRRS
jgi:hypothetical protein